MAKANPTKALSSLVEKNKMTIDPKVWIEGPKDDGKEHEKTKSVRRAKTPGRTVLPLLLPLLRCYVLAMTRDSN